MEHGPQEESAPVGTRVTQTGDPEFAPPMRPVQPPVAYACYTPVMGPPSAAARTTGRGTVHLAYDIVQDNQVRLTVSGLDLTDIPDHVARLLVSPGPPHLQLELDLSHETCLSPAGLALLLRARTAVWARRGELRLRGLRPSLRDQLTAMGIPELTRSSAELATAETAGDPPLLTADGRRRALPLSGPWTPWTGSQPQPSSTLAFPQGLPSWSAARTQAQLRTSRKPIMRTLP